MTLLHNNYNNNNNNLNYYDASLTAHMSIRQPAQHTIISTQPITAII